MLPDVHLHEGFPPLLSWAWVAEISWCGAFRTEEQLFLRWSICLEQLVHLVLLVQEDKDSVGSEADKQWNRASLKVQKMND